MHVVLIVSVVIPDRVSELGTAFWSFWGWQASLQTGELFRLF